MALPTVTLNEASPAGTGYIRNGDNRIREYKTQNREILEVDHYYPNSGQNDACGRHKQLTLIEAADIGSGATGIPILGAQTADGKAELVFTDEDDNDIQLTEAGYQKYNAPAAIAGLADIMEFIYPIGIVITLGVATDPADLLGIGTWAAIEGKVIVGISDEEGDAAFDTLDETGGAQTVKLTGGESGTSAHTHPVAIHNTSTVNGANISRTGSGGGAGTKTTNASTEADADDAHTNLQPYIVKYIWQRTA